MKSRAVHMPKIGHSGSVVDLAPLYCGAPRNAHTLVTIFSSKATCSRCIKANRLAEEDLEHQRVQAKLQRQREEQAAAREEEAAAVTARTIHYTTDEPGTTGRARGACGRWSERFTSDPAQVTCVSCLRAIDRKPTTKTEITMPRSSHILASFLLLAAACGSLPDDTGASTEAQTEIVTTTGDSEESTGNADSTSGEDSTSSTGDGTTGETTTGETGDGLDGSGSEAVTTSTGGEVKGMCYGESCEEFGCAAGLVCAPDPLFGVATCATPCGPPYACNEVTLAACGATDSTKAVCHMELPVPLCFPA